MEKRLHLLVLGCPGSGKSSISSYIAMLARDKGWTVRLINDYENLYRKYQADTEHKQFQSIAYGGFDILDPSIRDRALEELKEEIQLSSSVNNNELILIEFSRCNYDLALRFFDEDFLCNAHFLFLDTDADICKKRVHDRIVHPQSLNDHFVPDHVIDCFSRANNRQYIEAKFQMDYEIDANKIRIIDNNGLIKEAVDQIEHFVASLLLVPIPAAL